MRGAVVQLLGRLSVLKGSNLIWSKLWVGNARGQWISFSNQEKIRQRKERNGLLFSNAVPKIQWASNPHCPCRHLAMETLLPLFLPHKYFQTNVKI